jgi:hypothetical protein
VPPQIEPADAVEFHGPDPDELHVPIGSRGDHDPVTVAFLHLDREPPLRVVGRGGQPRESVSILNR